MPSNWYIEDGSGRALAFLQRALRHSEFERHIWAYIAVEPDPTSEFIIRHQELMR